MTIKALRAVQELNALGALPIYPVFEDEQTKAVEQKSIKHGVLFGCTGPYGLNYVQGRIRGGGGEVRGWLMRGWGGTSKNHHSHHKYKSPKQFL